MTSEEDAIKLLGPVMDEADLFFPDQTSLADVLQEQKAAEEKDVRTHTLGILDSFQDDLKSALPATDGGPLPTRPTIRRDGSVPTPRLSPPDIPPVAPSVPESLTDSIDSIDGTDSLSLQQLRALVKDLPKNEPAPCAFVYRDTASLAEELEEWFTYDSEDRIRIAQTHSSFSQVWRQWNDLTFTQIPDTASAPPDWIAAPIDQQTNFIARQIDGLKETDIHKRLFHLESLVYLALGAWYETSGLCSDSWMDYASHNTNATRSSNNVDTDGEPSSILETQYAPFGLQMKWLKRNTMQILSCHGVQPFIESFVSCIDRERIISIGTDMTDVIREAEKREVWCAAVLLYVFFEVVHSHANSLEKSKFRRDLLKAEPHLLCYLANILDTIRWTDDEFIHLLPRILMLSWKTILIMFGGLDELEQAKESLQLKDPSRNRITKPIITASPLHYHSFRQEIISKYPSYVPPKSDFALEPGQKSLLPILHNSSSRTSNAIVHTNLAQHGSSILHQSVHITTPAPSPPPSPAAGKGGKKQNYQTNQMFPFLYPPLDPTSNQLGGKGTTRLQDSIASKTWEGSDIPISILEASELFSSRIRSTRALHQLYSERSDFMRHDRGWVDRSDQIAPLDLTEQKSEEEKEGDDCPSAAATESETHPWKQQEHNGSLADRLQVVEKFYHDGLPHLQSIVVVILKTILHSLATIMSNPNGLLAQPQNLENGSGTAQVNGTEPSTTVYNDPPNLSLEELEQLRTQEITAKAASGFLLVLLKWFKLSHVLKFEYLCQLLVDANYIPIILKLLQSQELERVLNFKSDRHELSFFYCCQSMSRNALASSNLQSAQGQEYTTAESSEDEALPPAIKRYRSYTAASMSRQTSIASPLPHSLVPPEAGRAGASTSEPAESSIASFSWRNFFSSINFLRVLQKVCKNKAHRNLMLVQYKSASYLKKALKVPQQELRLYTLKLFKNQVPYCGRKWRQSNMRVITAVYLYCRPELRDDWLLSSDVDHDVNQAVPMEQSLRALTHYYNLKRYAKQMGATSDVLAEQDFFQKELDRLDWSAIEDCHDDDGAEHSMHWDDLPVDNM